MKSGFPTAAQAVLFAMAGWALSVSAASAATDPGVRAGPGAGDPVPGLTANEKTLFLDGQATFAEVDAVGDGLGPRFNLDSCIGCHVFPVHGGSSPPVNPQATIGLADGAKNVLPPFITASGPIREARFKFLANGQPVWIALPHPAWVEYHMVVVPIVITIGLRWWRGRAPKRVPSPPSAWIGSGSRACPWRSTWCRRFPAWVRAGRTSDRPPHASAGGSARGSWSPRSAGR